MKQMGLFD